MNTPILSEKEKTQFENDGFLIVAHRCASDLRTKVIKAMTQTSIIALSRTEGWELKAKEFVAWGLDVDEILNQVIAHESKGNEISAMLYRLFASIPEIIGLLDNSFLLKLSKEVGISMPCPSTLPITRIDRPSDILHKVPAHQDFWYSFVSENSVTIWFTYGALEYDMGFLEVVPGSHKRGLIPFKPHSGGPNPFVIKIDEPEENFIKVNVPENSVLIFDQKLLHRSGLNRSEKIRASIQVRYNDLTTMDVMDTTFRITHSPVVLQKQQDHLKSGLGNTTV